MESAPDKKKILDMPLGIAINFPLLFAFTIAIVGRAITIWRAIQKRSNESMCKTDTKNGTKSLRATFFATEKRPILQNLTFW